MFEPFRQVDATTVTAAWRWLAAARLWDLERVQRHPYNAAWTVDRYVFLTGISHTIAPPNVWKVGLTFQSATVWRSFTGSLFDTGRFDTATFVW